MAKRNTLKTKSKILTLAAIATVLLASCSCGWHLKQIQKRCPDYLQTDTVYEVRPAERYDTIFLLTPDTVVSTGSTTGAAADTFLIEKERVRVQLVRVRDTIFANVELPPDTVAIVRTVTVAAPCKKGLPWGVLPWVIGFAAVLTLWIRNRVKKEG
ncbi:MAG: hypothetical protein IKX51_08770 [Bacteroidales bacterium]|nr:hypothetical protein [Bacteroidales bacterium]